MSKRRKKKREDWQLPGAVGDAMARRGGAGAGIHGGDDKEGKKRRNKKTRKDWKREL